MSMKIISSETSFKEAETQNDQYEAAMIGAGGENDEEILKGFVSMIFKQGAGFKEFSLDFKATPPDGLVENPITKLLCLEAGKEASKILWPIFKREFDQLGLSHRALFFDPSVWETQIPRLFADSLWGSLGQ